MADSDVIVLNDGLEKRTRPSGKARYVVVMKSEPLVHNFDPKALGRGPAEAIASVLRERVSQISATVSAATLKYRKAAAKAFSEGKPWAVKRYSGGRTGAMPPRGDSAQMFNDSGRLAKTIVVGAKSDGYTVNVAANRLNPDTLTGGEAALQRIYAKLVELVPEFARPELLLNDLRVRRSIDSGIKAMIAKARETQEKLRAEQARAALDVGREVFGVLLELAG